MTEADSTDDEESYDPYWDEEPDYDVDSDTMAAIQTDVVLGRSPEQSLLTYTPDMLKARADIEKDVAEILAEDPHAIIVTPSELPFD